MNEPAVFSYPTGTMPLDVRHNGDGQPTDHREIHNVYGLLMTQSTHEGLRRLRPDERPFVLTRASYAGAQRWSALWPGDNISTWEHLRATIPMLTGMGLSGVSFVGSDIGGFAGAPSAELYTRWLQTGVFYPFMRTHTAIGTPDQEPWSYGTTHEAFNRAAIELRYQLLPHIYNVMAESTLTGLPAMRPLMLEYPDDPQTWGVDDAFMFGGDLLIAPVLHEAIRTREVYLPKGEWYDFWTGTHVTGGAVVQTPVTLERMPNLRPWRRVHLPPTSRAAYRRDARPAARSPGLSSADFRGRSVRRRWRVNGLREGAIDAPPLPSIAQRRGGDDRHRRTGRTVPTSRTKSRALGALGRRATPRRARFGDAHALSRRSRNSPTRPRDGPCRAMGL